MVMSTARISVQKNCLHKYNLGKAKLVTDGHKLILASSQAMTRRLTYLFLGICSFRNCKVTDTCELIKA